MRRRRPQLRFPLPSWDDCKDTAGRATHGAVAERARERELRAHLVTLILNKCDWDTRYSLCPLVLSRILDFVKRSSPRRFFVVALLLGKLVLGLFVHVPMAVAMPADMLSAEHCSGHSAESVTPENRPSDGAPSDMDCCKHHSCDCAGLHATALVTEVQSNFCVRSPCLEPANNFDGVTQLQLTSVFRPPA